MKKTRLILVALICLLVGGCGDDKFAEIDGYRVRCVGGVKYYYTGYALAPALNKDSTVKVCEN